METTLLAEKQEKEERRKLTPLNPSVDLFDTYFTMMIQIYPFVSTSTFFIFFLFAFHEHNLSLFLKETL